MHTLTEIFYRIHANDRYVEVSQHLVMAFKKIVLNKSDLGAGRFRLPGMLGQRVPVVGPGGDKWALQHSGNMQQRHIIVV